MSTSAATTMKAIVCTKYGAPSHLILKEVTKPVPKEEEVLIQIHATVVTASDILLRSMDQGWALNFLLQAMFGFGRPRNPILGMGLSGTVVNVGSKVTKFQLGDKVFAHGSTSAMTRRFGSYAEYQCLPEEWNLLKKPDNLTHEQAAALPYGALLARHSIVKGQIQEGQQVMVYGASGSIGSMAVQMAKHAGAVVTAVCSSKNAKLVQSLGADHVIDYTDPDAASHLKTYDLVLDAAGNSKTSELKTASQKALTPDTGKYISIDDDVPETPPSAFAKIQELAAEGSLTPVIDRSFPLEDMALAHAYVEQGHKTGNVVITVTDEATKT